MAVPTAPVITAPAAGSTVAQPVVVAWDASTFPTPTAPPPVAGFTWSDADFTPGSAPPVAAFTWNDETYTAPTAPPPVAAFTWSDANVAAGPTAAFTWSDS